jgi:hypothetical protein
LDYQLLFNAYESQKMTNASHPGFGRARNDEPAVGTYLLSAGFIFI